MSLTCRPDTAMLANFSRKGMSRRHTTSKKRPRHTQFISITADMFKSAQTYKYCTTIHFYVWAELRVCMSYVGDMMSSMLSNVVSFRQSSRHAMSPSWRHDRRHVANMSPTRHAMSANEGLGRHDRLRHSLLRLLVVGVGTSMVMQPYAYLLDLHTQLINWPTFRFYDLAAGIV
jgi:hypothetical protein